MNKILSVLVILFFGTSVFFFYQLRLTWGITSGDIMSTAQQRLTDARNYQSLLRDGNVDELAQLLATRRDASVIAMYESRNTFSVNRWFGRATSRAISRTDLALRREAASRSLRANDPSIRTVQAQEILRHYQEDT